MFKGTRHKEFRVSFRVSFHFEHSSEIVYCFIFLSTHPPTLGAFLWCHRVAERFIRHIIGFCLLLVHILNKLFSVPKSELCFIFVRGHSWGIIVVRYLDVYAKLMVCECLWCNSVGIFYLLILAKFWSIFYISHMFGATSLFERQENSFFLDLTSNELDFLKALK